MRLTNDIRRDLCARIISHGFDAREKALAAEGAALALIAYEKIYPVAVRSVMEALPAGFLETSNVVDVRVDGEYHRLVMDRERPCAANEKALTLTGDLAAKVKAFGRRLEALRNENREAAKSARAVLDRATTVAALVKAWPAVEAFTRDLEPKPVNALAIPIKSLNKQLGLPPGAR